MAFATHGQERGNARAETLSRETAFKALRAASSYFRRVGRAAMRTAVARADFDRVKVAPGAAADEPQPGDGERTEAAHKPLAEVVS